jgi:hypothetical protein
MRTDVKDTNVMSHPQVIYFVRKNPYSSPRNPMQ